MMDENDRRGRRYASILAVVAGITLTAAGAAAQRQGEQTTSPLEDDAEIYDAYDAGFDDINADDDWFFDYYEPETGIADPARTSDEIDLDTDFVPEYDWDTDAVDTGDDPGDEGLLDW